MLGKCVLLRDNPDARRLPRSQFQTVKKEDTSVSFSTKKELVLGCERSNYTA